MALYKHKPHFIPQTSQLGEDMQVGDLVHNPQYLYWGVGIVIEIVPEDVLDVRVRWIDGTLGWVAQRYLEVLCK